MMPSKSCLKNVQKSFTLWFSVLVPIICSPLIILSSSQEARCGYCVLVIGLYWVTEVIPLAVTSLLPVFLFPVFGVMTSSKVCSSYVKDTLMLFLGSLIVAVAVEKWNLHKRLALRTLTLVGPEPKWLLLGVMLPTWFLSMWMSNTATTAMMVPIVTAILGQIKACQFEGTEEESITTKPPSIPFPSVGVKTESHDEGTPGGSKNGNMLDEDKHSRSQKEFQQMETEVDLYHNITSTSTAFPPKSQSHDEGIPGGSKKGNVLDDMIIVDNPPENRANKEKQFLALAKAFALATAYSANIGGIATLTGTPPNIIFKGISDDLFAKHGETNPVNFANWIVAGLPVSLIILIFLWVWMQVYWQGWRLCCRRDKTSYEAVRQILKQEYESLGRMTFAEVMVSINFVILALLWMSRSPGGVPGWGKLFEPGYVKDSTPAILIAVLLFILPAKPPAWLCGFCKTKTESISEAVDSSASYTPILDWDTVNRRLPWGVLLLMGGGFALADACQESGLSAWVGQNLDGLMSLSPWIVAMLLSIMIAMATEVTSNAATTTLFIPIVGNLALHMGANPLYFMIPCTIATSLAFILPVATPPNAIVFATGFLKIKDMAVAGIPLNIFSVFVLNIALNTWIVPLYTLDDTPHGFSHNATL